jgi:hypothetical protein
MIGKREVAALTKVPCFERCFRNDDAQRVADASDDEFHASTLQHVITSASVGRKAAFNPGFFACGLR